MSALASLMLPLAFVGSMERLDAAATSAAAVPAAGQATRQALSDRSVWLLALGFFVCGFLVAFITKPMMGVAWLSIAPLINGVMASMFGVKNLAMLGGIVFFARQVGSFLGGWLGALIDNRTGSCGIAWGIAIALRAIGIVLNLPIKEQTVDTPWPTVKA